MVTDTQFLEAFANFRAWLASRSTPDPQADARFAEALARAAAAPADPAREAKLARCRARYLATFPTDELQVAERERFRARFVAIYVNGNEHEIDARLAEYPHEMDGDLMIGSMLVHGEQFTKRLAGGLDRPAQATRPARRAARRSRAR